MRSPCAASTGPRASAAAQRNEFSFAGGTALQQAQAAPAACVQGMAGQFPCRNLDFQSQIPLAQFSSRPVSAANVWGFVDLNDNREYAVVGTAQRHRDRRGHGPRESARGRHDPRQPVAVARGQGLSGVRRRRESLARVCVRRRPKPRTAACRSIDMSGLPQTAGLASTNLDTSSQHTLYVSNIDYATNAALPGLTPVLYVAGSNLNGGSWRAYSLANPTFPQLVSSAPTTRYMHDSTSLVVTDARAAQCAPGHNPCEVLVDFNVEAVELWDVTNKLQPVLLGTGDEPEQPLHPFRVADRQRHAPDVSRRARRDSARAADAALHARPRESARADGRKSATRARRRRRTTTATCAARATTSRTTGAASSSTTPRIPTRSSRSRTSTTTSRRARTSQAPTARGVSIRSCRRATLLVSDIENGLFVLRDQTRSLDSNAGRLGFGGARATAAENAGTINVRVQRTFGRVGDVSVQYATTAGSATEGADYTAASGTLSWPARRHRRQGHRDSRDERHERRKRRDVDADAVGVDRRRDARRLEHADGHDQRQRHGRARRAAAGRRRLVGPRAARAARGRPARPLRSATAPSAASRAKPTPAAARARRSSECADRAAGTARAHRAP